MNKQRIHTQKIISLWLTIFYTRPHLNSFTVVNKRLTNNPTRKQMTCYRKCRKMCFMLVYLCWCHQVVSFWVDQISSEVLWLAPLVKITNTFDKSRIKVCQVSWLESETNQTFIVLLRCILHYICCFYHNIYHNMRLWNTFKANS